MTSHNNNTTPTPRTTANERPLTAKVKKYAAMITCDVKKNPKNRIWHDGYLRHHHYNSKLYLLSYSDQAELVSQFYRPPYLPQISDGLPPDFVLREGQEIEFEGWIAEVMEVVHEAETNITEIRHVTKTARTTRIVEAREWASSFPEAGPSSSASSSRPIAPSSSPAPVKHSKRPLLSNNDEGAGYKGFGIAPPKSYYATTNAHSSNGKAPSTTKASSKTPSYHPYESSPQPDKYGRYPVSTTTTPLPPSRIQQHPAENGRPATPSLRIVNSKAVSSPFRPPAFVRPQKKP